jgi:dTDP-4-amino-4,6-dideoxygalactose transaminase
MTSTKSERIFLSPPHMGGEEVRLVQEAFESNYIAPIGPMINAFEQEFAEYVGIKHCLALSSGTCSYAYCVQMLAVQAGCEWGER